MECAQFSPSMTALPLDCCCWILHSLDTPMRSLSPQPFHLNILFFLPLARSEDSTRTSGAPSCSSPTRSRRVMIPRLPPFRRMAVAARWPGRLGPSGPGAGPAPVAEACIARRCRCKSTGPSTSCACVCVHVCVRVCPCVCVCVCVPQTRFISIGFGVCDQPASRCQRVTCLG